jgi:hypothetical protein
MKASYPVAVKVPVKLQSQQKIRNNKELPEKEYFYFKDNCYRNTLRKALSI